MEFGWINALGGGIVVLMLIPNLLFALRRPGGAIGAPTPLLNVLEQVGRYACMALMVLPLGTWKFGFPSLGAMLAYLAGNAALLAAYYGFWVLYFRQETRRRALALALIPAGIFLLSGLTLGHWPLILAALVFGPAHTAIIRKNYEKTS